MHSYYAYGLFLESEITLSAKIARVEKSDVKIKIASLANENSQTINSNKSNRVLGELPGIARFLIEEGKVIFVDPEPGIDAAVLSPCILGSAMSVLLQQRGFLVLHASCVVIEGVAVAFLGHSGDGKSTICSAFHSRGYEILTDDVMALRIESDRILVIPSIPQIKLRGDSANSLGYREGILSPLHHLTKKKVHQIQEGFYDQPVRLKQIYLLDKGEQNQIQALSSQESFIELIRHTRAVKTLKSQNLEQAHFQKCVTIVQNISLSKLIRRFSLSELSNVMDLVEQDLKNHQIEHSKKPKLLAQTYNNSKV